MDTLSILKLDIELMGQGYDYDNSANMKGNLKKLQNREPQLNPRAFYTLCGSNNLNFTFCDIVTC